MLKGQTLSWRRPWLQELLAHLEFHRGRRVADGLRLQVYITALPCGSRSGCSARGSVGRENSSEMPFVAAATAVDDIRSRMDRFTGTWRPIGPNRHIIYENGRALLRSPGNGSPPRPLLDLELVRRFTKCPHLRRRGQKGSCFTTHERIMKQQRVKAHRVPSLTNSSPYKTNTHTHTPHRPELSFFSKLILASVSFASPPNCDSPNCSHLKLICSSETPECSPQNCHGVAEWHQILCYFSPHNSYRETSILDILHKPVSRSRFFQPTEWHRRSFLPLIKNSICFICQVDARVLLPWRREDVAHAGPKVSQQFLRRQLSGSVHYSA